MQKAQEKTFYDVPAQGISRRNVLRALGAAGLTLPFAMHGLGARAAAPLRDFKLAWNANAICLSPVPVAQELGIFEKHGLKVELINYSGSTDQLLESIATGKADAGVGMVHRWIKPLESGFDVKLISSMHGGCTRLVGYAPAGVTSVDKLRGKTIGVSDLNSPGKNFFSVVFTRAGLDPNKDVTWRQFPADLLSVAIEKGEIQAIADSDPNLYLIERRTKGLVEISSNLSGEYADKVCCVIGVGGKLVRNERPVAAALARAINEASDFVHNNPNETAKLFSKYTTVAQADLRAVLGTLTHNHHPSGVPLKKEIEFFARDFKLVGVLKPSTDPARFAEHVFSDVLV